MGIGVGIASLLGSLGVGAETAATIGSIAAPALLGGGMSALSGSNFGKGALLGGLGGAMGLTGGSGLAGILGGAGPAAAASGGGGASALASGVGGAGGGALSAAGGAAGALGGGGDSLLKNMRMLGALGSMFASKNPRPDYGTSPAPSDLDLGPLFNKQMQGSGYIDRTASNPEPSGRSYYTYGSGPEQMFFSNNRVDLSGNNPSQQVPGHRRGGALHIAGGRDYGDGGHVNESMGDGLSDSVPARLSDGEYVWPALDVALLGGGDTNSGVRKLNQMRGALHRDVGVSQKYQRAPKAPEQYLRRSS